MYGSWCYSAASVTSTWSEGNLIEKGSLQCKAHIHKAPTQIRCQELCGFCHTDTGISFRRRVEVQVKSVCTWIYLGNHSDQGQKGGKRRNIRHVIGTRDSMLQREAVWARLIEEKSSRGPGGVTVVPIHIID